MKILSTCLLVLLCLAGKAQGVATNWTITDCSGGNHELFADLDAGKVAVIIWVMPCANCIDEALLVQTEVQNALATNPGKIVFYLADDYGNTNCTTLSSWASQNGVTAATVVNSKSVSMTPYGAAGMPKVVIVGGSEHKVFYNANAPNVTANGVKGGIVAALAAPTGIEKNTLEQASVSLFPNPTTNSIKIKLNVLRDSHYRMEVLNTAGQVVSIVTEKSLSSGVYEFAYDTSLLADGTYFISVGDCEKKLRGKFIVTH